MIRPATLSAALVASALWIGPAVGQNAPSRPMRLSLGNGGPQASKAAITVHLPAEGNGTAIVICPGGGYGGLVVEAEGHGIANWLNEHGIAGIVLEYELPKGRPRVPLRDAQRAIRVTRAHADQWHLDPNRIGIMGFSAGGHLASTAGTHFDAGDPNSPDPIDRMSCRPDFMILIYPVITMGEHTHRGSKRNLLGADPAPEWVASFSNETQVTGDTPPTFLAHAQDDTVVVPKNSLMFHEALKAHGVASEYLKLPSGGHGLNGYQGPMWDAWQTAALRWLAKEGLVPDRPTDCRLPRVNVTNVRRVFHNGEHNAFTDLIRWHGKFWLTFRSCPDGHMVYPTSSIIVLSSENLETWKQETRFSVPKRDTRDPHFLDFQNKLFVYTGTWYSGDGPLPRDQYDLNKHLGYAVWTDDGESWYGPQQLEGTYGHYIWRAAASGGKAYLCGRRNRGFAQVAGERDLVQSAMLESDDGLIWRFHSLFQENRGDETAFLFQDDGSLLGVSRSGSRPAQLVKSPPPYVQWTRKDLSEYVGGPLLARWGDRLLVGGRRNTDRGPKTTLYWLADDRLHPAAELPSGGDNSYPGFVALSPTRGVVSWYSSHEKDEAGHTITAIYMADLEIVDEATGR